MKKLAKKMYWIGNSLFQDDEMANEISELLCSDNYEVELYGVDLYTEKLPANYTIVDYRTRETLVICRNGEVYDTQEEIEEILRDEENE